MIFTVKATIEKTIPVVGLAIFLSASANAQIISANAKTGTNNAQNAEEVDNRTSAVEAAPDQNGDIVVTGSRIDRAGFDTPTPTAVLGDTEIRLGSRPSVAQIINDLPQVRATTSPQSNAANLNSGQSTIDLRGLGDARTLTLLNGRRFAGSTDLNNVPLPLLKRIEVVTGGASAAWGSGAVAGVVNIILDDKLTGLSLSGKTGLSSRGDGARYGIDASFGAGFADDRGHVIVAAAYQTDLGILDRNSRYGLSSALFVNPLYAPGNGQSQFFLAADVNYADASPSTLITSGVLAGQTFQNNGALRPFIYGSPRTSTLMVGGEGINSSDQYPIYPPSDRLNLYGRATFDIGDAKFWIDGNFAINTANLYTRSENIRGTLSISRDNAFLLPSIRAQLIAAGETSFNVGRLFNDYGYFRFDYTRRNVDTGIGVDGSFADGKWRYSAYF